MYEFQEEQTRISTLQNIRCRTRRPTISGTQNYTIENVYSTTHSLYNVHLTQQPPM